MPNKAKSKVFLVEDDKFLSKVYKDGLSRAGYEISWVSDGNAALESIRTAKPDLILLDLIIPYKNGFEVLEELKNDSELAKIPVIILSNLGQDADIKRGKELGAADYLIKTSSSLVQVIEKVKYQLTKKIPKQEA